jgi:hypothetical protein
MAEELAGQAEELRATLSYFKIADSFHRGERSSSVAARRNEGYPALSGDDSRGVLKGYPCCRPVRPARNINDKKTFFRADCGTRDRLPCVANTSYMRILSLRGRPARKCQNQWASSSGGSLSSRIPDNIFPGNVQY